MHLYAAITKMDWGCRRWWCADCQNDYTCQHWAAGRRAKPEAFHYIQLRGTAVELHGNTGDREGMNGLDVSGSHRADRAIMDRVAAGDQAALAALYDEHARSVYSLACRILTDRTEAEDIVQEVFAQAWRQAARYEPRRASVAGWLLMITRARAIDRVRARRARPLPADAAMPDLPDLNPGQEAVTITAESVERLRTALAKLPDSQRTPIELAYYEGLTQADIAETLHEPLGTVKTRMRAALHTLRAALGRGETS
jgi:RNA polymerase sigma-70 factor (ECF subfamily)